jgi:hypothetical protein
MIAEMSTVARNETYRANESLFSGYRYIGVLDDRQCLVCGSMDQTVFKTLEEMPHLPQHRGCRCVAIPEVKGLEGFDDDDERASMDGPVPASTSYADWLAKQDPEVQRDILGPTRYSLYKEGMPITSFVSNGEKLNLHQLVEKEGLELFGAGLKDKSFHAQKAYSDTYYDAIRNRTDPTDIEKISNYTGFSYNDVRSIRNHLFIDEHDLGDGEFGRFSSNWQIAQSWQRMEQGWKGNDMDRYHDVDILLLRHELEELTQMVKYGYDTMKAHEVAESKYLWDIKSKDIK